MIVVASSKGFRAADWEDDQKTTTAEKTIDDLNDEDQDWIKKLKKQAWRQ